MKIDCDWTGKSKFVANVNGFKIHMDATKPFGDELAPTPKQLVLAAICGCTGMDVVSLLKKNKQPMDKFKIEAEATVADTHPNDFKDVTLKYFIDGSCDPSKVTEAVSLSQSKYCAVSAMVSRGAKITFDVLLNGKLLNNGTANFIKTNLKITPGQAQQL